MSPAASVGQLVEVCSIVEIAARVAVLIVVVCFGVFLRALVAPKATTVGAPSVQRLQHVAAGHKKKGGRAKKNKKARGAAVPNVAHDADAISDAEDKVRTSSDLEAATSCGADGSNTVTSDTPEAEHEIEMQVDRADASCDGDDDCSETIEAPEVANEIQTGTLQAEELCGAAEQRSQTSPASNNVQEFQQPLACGPDEPCHEADENAGAFCDICERPDVHFWGCATHRTYTSALLLMHRDMRFDAARGPPGLELPAANIRTTKCGLTTSRMPCRN